MRAIRCCFGVPYDVLQSFFYSRNCCSEASPRSHSGLFERADLWTLVRQSTSSGQSVMSLQKPAQLVNMFIFDDVSEIF
jgi:hypothetical protein